MRSNETYKPRYGQWAGRPQGASPDFEKCCVEVWPSGRGEMHHQCRKARGHGPGEAYCKQHDPDAVKARKDEAHRQYVAGWNARRYGMNGRIFYDALKLIAEGHNDARGLAADVLNEFEQGAMK